jgi:hypothetical protein
MKDGFGQKFFKTKKTRPPGIAPDGLAAALLARISGHCRSPPADLTFPPEPSATLASDEFEAFICPTPILCND